MFGCKKKLALLGLFSLLEVLLVLVKQSRTIFKLSNSSQDVYVLRMWIAHSVVKCMWSNGQGPICSAVKWSSNKNDSHPVCSCDYSTYGSDHLLHRAISAPISSVRSQQKYDCSMVRFMVTSVNKHKLLYFLQMGRGYSENYDGSSSRGVEL